MVELSVESETYSHIRLSSSGALTLGSFWTMLPVSRWCISGQAASRYLLGSGIVPGPALFLGQHLAWRRAFLAGYPVQHVGLTTSLHGSHQWATGPEYFKDLTYLPGES